jgi:TolB protein
MAVRNMSKLLWALCLFGMLMSSPLNAQPAHSPKIAFCAFGAQGFDLGITDTGHTAKMLTNSHFALYPYLSPDGKSLFFSERGDSQFGTILQIYRYDLEKHQITRISDGSAIDEYPVCSPDGKRLAFISRPADPALKDTPYHIYFSDLSGKNREAMDSDDEGPQLYPSWSPDGDKIVYSFLSFPWAGLKVRDLKKQTTISLVPFYFYPMEPNWSPSSDQIAFTSCNPLKSTTQIWIVKADGSGRYQLTDGPSDRYPSWFPDGRRLVFTRNESKEKGKEIRGVYVIDLKTQKITRLFGIKDCSLEFPRIALAP